VAVTDSYPRATQSGDDSDMPHSVPFEELGRECGLGQQADLLLSVMAEVPSVAWCIPA
jgi:hypothetical protein